MERGQSLPFEPRLGSRHADFMHGRSDLQLIVWVFYVSCRPIKWNGAPNHGGQSDKLVGNPWPMSKDL